MPSTKTRIAIVAPDELVAALDDLADATGKTRAGVAAEMLMQMVPQLHGFAKYSRHIKANQHAAAKRELVHMFGDGMAEVLHEQRSLQLPQPKRK